MKFNVICIEFQQKIKHPKNLKFGLLRIVSFLFFKTFKA